MNGTPQPSIEDRHPLSLSQQVGTLVTVLGLVALTTLVLWLARDSLTLGSNALVYMLVVILVAVWRGTTAAVFGAILSFFALNFFLLRPYYSLAVADASEVLELFLFLAAALIAGRLAGYARQQASISRKVAIEQAELYSLVSTLNQLGDRDAVLQELRRVAREEIGVLELDILPYDGSVPQMDRAVHYVLLSAGDSVYGTVRAVFPVEATPTQQRFLQACVAQTAIALQRVELADQVQRGRALSEADALKTAILRAVSHDLRTPLTIIKSSAANLVRPGPRLSPDEQRELAEIIESEADHLNRLVGNLLDLSRLQAGALALNIEFNSLEEIAADVAADMHQRVGSKRLELDFPGFLPLVCCDYGLMVQAVSNIVENALRYEPDGRSVVIAGRAEDGLVTLAIVNHGPTIPDADKGRVTEPFFQLAEGEPVASHVGLGLAIARGIVEAHHGQLNVQDTPGGGATFVIALPFEEISA